MIILGFIGGFDLPYESRYVTWTTGPNHDAAAVLLVDGKVVSAIEEERLTRMKHTNKAPIFAIKFVLDDYGIQLKDVDKIVTYGSEELLNRVIKESSTGQDNDAQDIRTFYTRMFKEQLGHQIDHKNLIFVDHHRAHAVSTYHMSGFDSSLVLTMDYEGDGLSVTISIGENGRLKRVQELPLSNSLGKFYLDVIEFLGYGLFEEYKVMGLAPYGDPGKYRDHFKSLYQLLPDGKYIVHFNSISMFYAIYSQRKRGEPISQMHKNIAAALQETLEDILMHVLRHWQWKCHQTKLCLAGGVAHNCSANGKILYSGMFDEVFVQPASHDAGCALGAALDVYHRTHPQNQPAPQLEEVYWGTDIGDNDTISASLASWADIIHYEKINNITEAAAALLAEGQVLGWMQGRSEFGPRALGNRSIVADPRPPENKDIINAMVKKREAFRPFAPSVMEKYVDEYYHLPFKTKHFPFMSIVIKVKDEKQKLLGAVTHVDGTARIHTVSPKTNKKYWELIEAFRKITGIPILLNTSFNNNVEPIVDSVYDALVCFLTTRLNYLVAGDYLIGKKDFHYTEYLKMIPSIPYHISIHQSRKYTSFHEMGNCFEIKNHYNQRDQSVISPGLFFILCDVNGKISLKDLMEMHEIKNEEKKKSIIDEILNLWGLRLLKLVPGETREGR